MEVKHLGLLENNDNNQKGQRNSRLVHFQALVQTKQLLSIKLAFF